MTDYSLPLLVSRKLLKEYEHAMLKRDNAKAYQIAHDLVELTLKLQDIADAKNSSING
jgi:hypothetical protein